MPLVDNLQIVPFSTTKGQGIIHPVTLRYPNTVVEALKNQLVSTNWAIAETLFATCGVVYPLGFPSGLTGSGSVGCGTRYITIETAIASFSYSGYYPGATPVGRDCIMFPFGATPLASLTNLALSITATSPYNAGITVDGLTYIMTLTAKLGGPAANFDSVVADGRYGISGQTVLGGGYKMASVGTSYYEVSITSGLGFEGAVNVQFLFALGPSGNIGNVLYELNITDQTFQMVSNPYSFAMFVLGDTFDAMAAFAPCVPVSEGFTACYNVFTVTNALTSMLIWDGFTAGFPNSWSLDALPVTNTDNLRNPQVLVLRAGPNAAQTLNGQPLTHAAYTLMSKGYSDQPSVTGKLWDCMVTTQLIPIGQTIMIGGRTYVCIASTTGSGNTVSSLLFCVNDNGQTSPSGGPTDTGGAGDGGGSSPTNPSAPPASGNGSLSGTCTSTGTPNNQTIFWESGDKFSSSVVGQTITITLYGLAHPWVSAGGSGDATGTIPIIGTFVSSTEITTTEGLNSAFFGASFTIP